MLHVLDFEGNIIDFISDQDNYLESALMVKDKAETLETFEFDIDSDRAENMRERNRIIVQDSNGQYREFIIVRIEDDLEDRTFVECNASYLEDINTAKPLAPGKYEAMTTSQALKEVLKDTGWQASESTEYGGTRTTTWTTYHTPYEVLKQLGTTYDMEIDFYIELGSNKVKGRYVEMHKPKPLFKGKEITYGKDLTGMSKTVDISELHTALMALGPEDENGNREVLTVVDNTAHQQFGLPNRYIWGIYEPQSEDTSMTAQRLKTLATTQLNKDKQAAVSYEITAADISQQFPHEKTAIGDIVRVKDREFNPPLYIEAEVMREEYNPIKKESTYTFGNIVEYLESTLRKDFMERLNDIRQKMNDSVTNLNTIIEQTTAGNIETFERKIFKSDTAPSNPVNDMLWYDTSNPEVAVLRRYWNGEWREETVSDVEQIGGVTREKALFSELSNAFINLNIQHSKLLSEVYEVIDSEYLVDTALKQQVQQNLDNTINVYNAIKTNLESMTPETATIGKLVDTQALFLKYRELLQTLYNSLENAKIAIDDRFKLLQSQYTDEKFNDAMSKVAEGIGGTWNAETGQLLSDIPSQQELEDALKTYINGQDAALKQLIDGEVNSKITQTKNELSSNISAVSAKVDGIQVGGRNLIKNSDKTLINEGKKLILPFALVNESDCYTLSFNAYLGKITDITKPNTIEVTYKLTDMFGERFETFTKIIDVSDIVQPDKTIEERLHLTIDAGGWYGIEDIYIDVSKLRLDTIQVYNFQLEQGNIATAYQKAPEDTENLITTAQTRFNSDIKQLKDSVTLKADKTEIKTMYDNNIKPLERQVNDNSAELKIQSDRINSKVSNEQYTADVDDIISKLNSAESQRIQLSNQIADKVSISEYTSGIDSVKSTNRNYIQSYYSSAQNSTSGIAKGPYNVELNASQRINFYFYDRDNSVNTALEQDTDYILNVHESSPEIKVGVFYKKGSYTIVGYTTDKIIRFNTGNREDILIVILSNTNNQFIGKVSLYKGSKELDWSPAPEDVELLGMTAENNAKSYTDKYKNENEAKLNLINTEIAQNGRDINARATKEEFNASRKTLSKVVSDLTVNTTTGLTLSYDENGNITSSTVGPDGIMLKGD
ncbi:hypothetical protein HMPREF2997_10830, partial [Staphylococcus sp. HMSC057C08]|uniref:phage tail spike protein n=1 Tax=Staphylococcus sp. HMSC057C08 TaxID=1739501 RepID=UPI0008A211C9